VFSTSLIGAFKPFKYRLFWGFLLTRRDWSKALNESGTYEDDRRSLWKKFQGTWEDLLGVIGECGAMLCSGGPLEIEEER